MVCKPDPRTAVCGGVVFARIFEEAGLPPGVFHMLPGGADVGAAVVDDPLIRVIAFTGSTRAGQDHRAGGRGAAQAGAPGAGRELRADRARRRRPGEGGVGRGVRVVQPLRQICMATSRHLVSAKIAGDYAAVLAEHAEPHAGRRPDPRRRRRWARSSTPGSATTSTAS